MMDQRPKPQAEETRSKPEITPPDHAERSAHDTSRMRIFVDAHGTERVYSAKLGPLGIILVALTIGLLLAVMLILLLGAFLIWIPVVGLLVAAAIISRLLRAYFQRAP
jgi:hypothetical protein